MKMVPLLKVSDMPSAIKHYTQLLDFSILWKKDPVDVSLVDLGHAEIELQITTGESDRLFCTVVNVYVDEVDALFAKYKSRGLDTSAKPYSPVYQGPVDQTWGNREFYITDADGNTLRFCKNIG